MGVLINDEWKRGTREPPPYDGVRRRGCTVSAGEGVRLHLVLKMDVCVAVT